MLHYYNKESHILKSIHVNPKHKQLNSSYYYMVSQSILKSKYWHLETGEGKVSI